MGNYGQQVRNLSWNNFLINENIVERNEFTFLTGIQIDHNRYQQLTACLKRLVKKLHSIGNKPSPLNEFFDKIKKGSKKYRNIMDNVLVKDNYFNKQAQVKTYKWICEIGVYSETRAKHNLIFVENSQLPY